MYPETKQKIVSTIRNYVIFLLMLYGSKLGLYQLMYGKGPTLQALYEKARVGIETLIFVSSIVSFVLLSWYVIRAQFGLDEGHSSQEEVTYYPQVDKKAYQAFIKKYKSYLPILYQFKYDITQDLTRDMVFGLTYNIRMDNILMSFIQKAGALKVVNGAVQFKYGNIIDKDTSKTVSKLKTTETILFKTAKERKEYIESINTALNKLSLMCCYTHLKDFDELTLKNIFCMYSTQPEKLEIPTDDYTIRSTFKYQEDGTILFSCTIDFNNELLGQRFLSKGIDTFIKESNILVFDAMIMQKSLTSATYLFDDILSLYILLLNLNNSVQAFVKQESETVLSYVQEEVRKQVDQDFNRIHDESVSKPMNING